MDEKDFILAAYSEYLRDAPEWPEVRNETREVTRLTRDGPEDVTLFIRECFRLACTKDKKLVYYNFSLRNMVSPTLKQIRIFGKILSLNDRPNDVTLKVYDGTGVIKVFYNKKKGKDYKGTPFRLQQINQEKDFDVDTEARGSKKCVFRSNGGRTSTRSVSMRNKSKRKVINEDPSRVPLKVKGFMTAIGVVSLTSTKERTESDNQNLWERNMMPPILFIAYKVESMTEREYINNCTALADLFKKRYTKD